MNRNNRTNNLIKWFFIIGDFVVLNCVLLLFFNQYDKVSNWNDEKVNMFWMMNNFALIFAEYRFSTIIHLRQIGAGDILKRTVELVSSQTLIAYLLLRIVHFEARIGWRLLTMGVIFLLALVVVRLIERYYLKKLRESGRNTRTATLVGDGKDILRVYSNLLKDPTLGYRILGFYGDYIEGEVEDTNKIGAGKNLKPLNRLGSVTDFFEVLQKPENQQLGDELYLCISRKEQEKILAVSKWCDKHVVHFFYVPLTSESLNMQEVSMNDMEVYTTFVSPLEDTLNKFIKRLFDIFCSTVFLLFTGILLPFVYVFIKIQSPGPLFFKQKRTGLDGKDFYCYKFRSMYVNNDSDKIQATENDPRKFPFGNFMRKTNIDELPQFWNVLKGNMSIVGPRPHMLAHTEQYSHLIDKYMVRHFVKPGVTGWAQVTGFRGETKELWQMEGRVERDIWYIQHWSIWLDIRIIWMTVKTIFIHDLHAY